MSDIKTGWLSPTGEFFPCSTYAHIDTACKICAELFKVDSIYISNPDIKLMDLGWVSITITSFVDHGFSICYKGHLTSEQKSFLKPYYNGEYWLGLTHSSMCAYERECER